MTGAEARRAFFEAQRLAQEDKARCRRCGQTKLLAEHVSVWFKGTLVYAACSTCFDDADLVVRRAPGGLEVRSVGRRDVVKLVDCVRPGLEPVAVPKKVEHG